MAQDFFAAFGQDGVGQIGTEWSRNTSLGDMAGDFDDRRAGAGVFPLFFFFFFFFFFFLFFLWLLTTGQNQSIQITAEKSFGDKWGSTMAEPDRTPVTIQELLISSLAQTDALAKLLIEKGLITEQSLCRRFLRNGRRIRSY